MMMHVKQGIVGGMYVLLLAVASLDRLNEFGWSMYWGTRVSGTRLHRCVVVEIRSS
jgi:hypothetical protein